MPTLDLAPRASPLGCPHCGTLQRLPAAPRTGVLIDCAFCRLPIERRIVRSRTAALCCAAAGLLLLIPANIATFLTTAILGVTRSSVLWSSAGTMFERGYADLGTVVWLLVVAFPILRLGLLTFVLGSLQVGWRPKALGPAFRAANALEVWAMADVFLAGSVVAYERLRTTISVEIGLGAYCFTAAALLSLLVRATLDKAAVWEAIAPQPPVAAEAPAVGATPHRPTSPASSGEAGQAPPGPKGPVACEGCALLCAAEAEGHRCPRCAARLHRRKADAIERASALTLAAALLYIPANAYPIATLPIGFTSVKYTVIQGVIDLYDSKLYALAALVLTASFAIPMLKLAVLAWCVLTVLRRTTARLGLKTRAYQVVEEIGRWSMIDPFVIACFVPVTQYNELVNGRVEPAAPAFTAVVLLTIFATHAFDTRLLWDGRMAARPHD